MSEALRVWRRPRLKNPSLVVGWSGDRGQLSGEIIDCLVGKLRARPFAEVEPPGFFPLGGVSVEGSVVQFPESTFYAYSKSNLILFRSVPPSFEWFKFLNLVLDMGERFGQVREVYTLGGMVSLTAHTVPRQMLGVFNSSQLQQAVGGYDFARPLDYETPPGQRPTLSSFLVWAAGQRRIPAASLWVPVPFYLFPVGDVRAKRKLLDFLSWRFRLGLDLSDVDGEVRRWEMALAEVRREVPDVDAWILRLESHQMLSDEERQQLVERVVSGLGERQS